MFRRVSVAAVAALLAHAAPASAEDFCWVTFHLGTTTHLFSLNAYANYEAGPGGFLGESTFVQCEALNDMVVSVGDVDALQTLSMAAVNSIASTLQGPKDFLRCKWVPSGRNPILADFDMSEQSAFNMSFQPVFPNVSVSDIDCSGIGGTTTTTTLREELCGDFDGNAKLQITDALGVLRTAVGLAECDPCQCDIDGNGSVSITDALSTLKLAVGTNVSTNCPGC